MVPVSAGHSRLGNWTRLKSEKGLTRLLPAVSTRRLLFRFSATSFPSSGRRTASSQPRIGPLPGCSVDRTGTSGRLGKTFLSKILYVFYIVISSHTVSEVYFMIKNMSLYCCLSYVVYAGVFKILACRSESSSILNPGLHSMPNRLYWHIKFQLFSTLSRWKSRNAFRAL